MNRFLRSALFPVVVITLIVWLGTQTLMGHRHAAKKQTLSSAIELLHPEKDRISRYPG